jgi:hypothetical protein
VISIPIISEFDGKGISNAVQQFKQLEGAGSKAQFAIKKAAVPAAAALGGLAVALGDAVKGAMEDQAAQKQLALAIKNSTGATDDQIASVEDWISAQGRLLGVADDELRPALAKLVRQTNDVKDAQDAVRLAMDISAGTGKDLGTVTTALEKAYGGQVTALAKLDPSLKGLIKDGMSAGEAMGILQAKFADSADAAASTAQGGFKRLNLTLSETKESIGAALLPVVEKALPELQKFADWAQENPEVFTKVALAIGGIATATMAVNAAMAANPYVIAAAGVVALYLAFDELYKRLDKFSKLGGTAAKLIGLILGPVSAAPVLNGLFGGGGGGNQSPKGGGGGVPRMAEGGIVASPTLALIGEAGPEAVVPLSKMGQMGNNVTIHVNGGDPNAVVAALRTYMRQNGSVPIRTSTIY